MPFDQTISFSSRAQSALVSIPDASLSGPGVMTPAQVAQLASGGGGGGQRGTAVFVAASVVSIVLATPIPGAYVITLTPSLDSGSGAMPSVAYNNKSGTGFDIDVGTSFTGTVDWSATAV
jgi:hypothetical protein